MKLETLNSSVRQMQAVNVLMNDTFYLKSLTAATEVGSCLLFPLRYSLSLSLSLSLTATQLFRIPQDPPVIDVPKSLSLVSCDLLVTS